MPTPTEILQALSAIANEQSALAAAWHALIAVTVIGILLGWRPTKRSGAVALAIPLISVSAMAWAYGNPFNGLVFLLAAAAVVVLGRRRPGAKVDRPPLWAAAAGLIMIVFGWVYPHFLDDGGWVAYLTRSPAGLIPCPTLSFVIGFTLLADGFSSRGLSVTLAVLGVFYGLFGAFRLGVRIDLVLTLGATALLALAFGPGCSETEPKPTSR